MKYTTIGIGIAVIGAAAGATAITFPSTFAGAFGSSHEDFIAPQAIDLNAGYIRQSISNFSVESAIRRLDGQKRDRVARFGRSSSAMGPIEGLNRIASTTQVVDDETVEMKMSFDGNLVSTIEVLIVPINESRSTIDVQVKLDYDWLSDSGKVLPGDLARLEPLVELLATEYVMATMQRRPFAQSDGDLAQIYGQETLDRIEARVGRRSDAKKRVEAALEAEFVRPVDDFEASLQPRGNRGELERRFRGIESEMHHPRHTPGEGFRQPDDDDSDSNWGNN